MEQEIQQPKNRQIGINVTDAEYVIYMNLSKMETKKFREYIYVLMHDALKKYEEESK